MPRDGRCVTQIWVVSVCASSGTTFWCLLMRHHRTGHTWNIDVDCDCITKTVKHCTGQCCGAVTKAAGVVLVLPGGGKSTAFAEPAALTPDWCLRLGEPLMSPHRAYKGYLSSIFTGVLKNALPWADTWLGQILGGAAWLQVAILSGFSRAPAMRAMHRAVSKAYAGSPHAHQATTRRLYHLSHKQPLRRCQVARLIERWLEKHAYWDGSLHSAWILPPDLTVGGIRGT